MRSVAQILSRKGSNTVSVSPQSTVLEALRIMAEKNIGSVMVMEQDQLVGIMTERDYSRKVILKGKSSTDTLVVEIMSTGFPKVTPRDTIETCMQLMSENNIRYLPVYDSDNQLSGIVSMNDVVRETISAQAETISSLKDYMHSGL
jgi:CBS domain-containing protein